MFIFLININFFIKDIFYFIFLMSRKNFLGFERHHECNVSRDFEWNVEGYKRKRATVSPSPLHLNISNFLHLRHS